MITNIIITKQNLDCFTFLNYQKIGSSKISDQTLDPGTKVQTLEGEYICTEHSRLAIDVAGNIYPIAESIFKKSYVLA